MPLKTIEGTFIAPQGKYALVVGRFNSFVVESLVSGAVDALVRHGVSENNITIIRAPGAFEIPLVAQKVAQQGEYDAIVALGAVKSEFTRVTFTSSENANKLSPVLITPQTSGTPESFKYLLQPNLLLR